MVSDLPTCRHERGQEGVIHYRGRVIGDALAAPANDRNMTRRREKESWLNDKV